MKQVLAWACWSLAWAATAAEIKTDWAYHGRADGALSPAKENIPGQGYAFIGNANTVIPDAEPVTLYVLTDQNFAGDADEQVLVRWWNGKEEKWLMGKWEKNITLGQGEGAVEPFHGQPETGATTLDLWSVEVPAELTLPGENYYVIQLKGWQKDAEPAEVLLLRDASGEFTVVNKLGQAWTASKNYAGQDWKVTILE